MLDVEVTVEDLLIYSKELETNLEVIEVRVSELEEFNVGLDVENFGLRRRIAGFKAARTRRKSLIWNMNSTMEYYQEQNALLEAQVINMKRSIAAYKANATRRNRK